MRKHILLTLLLACGLITTSIFADSCCPTTSDSCSVACLSSTCDDCEVCDDCDECKCSVYGRSFFSVRPQFQSASPEKVSLFRHRDSARKAEDAKGGAVQLTVFGGKSTNKAGMRSYFFPKCAKSLGVKEELDIDQVYGPTEGVDLHPIHFRVVSQNWLASAAVNQDADRTELTAPFESSITICPRQSVFGLGFTWRQNLSKLMDSDDEDKDFQWWLEVSTPLTRVKNRLNFKETITTSMEDAGGVVDVASITGLDADHIFYATMEEAVVQPAWQYGKMCKNLEAKWRLADIEVKLGWEWNSECMCHLEGYAGVLIPTGNKVTAEYMFEPIVGHRKHFGILKGGAACFKIWEDEEEGKTLRFTMDMNALYLFKKCEKRSFDLKGKPWSRYMEVYADLADATKANNLYAAGNTNAGFLYSTPGINIFTRDMTVRPRLSCNSTTALVYDKEETGFRGEIGYNCYCRQRECVELECAWPEVAALKAYGGIGTTSILRKIDFDSSVHPNLAGGTATIDRAIGEYEYSIIKLEDLDLESAAAPSAFSHTFYFAMGKNWEEDEDREYPLFLGAGFSYEYGADNTAMSRWLGWVKGGVSF